ncbi:hypothetical protein T440DRAFT_469371 [Plenodomus tracheiphilus IPT5]|uniref:Uncharacterized protein n=1 Tax=Plenodomus tracheiphilus IPT5 TaxID=1408161 RepID=A0A6A7B4A1_9PLEO|nr:hypothetical protein T440DRAFT_469371 [Plenodomus tracheiphilus IPT5]
MPFYEESSGQVYTETVSAEVRSMIPAWPRHTSGRRIDPSKHRERCNGTSSLQDMALRSCLWHFDSMEPEALQWLGWHYARWIYKQLKETDTLSFNAWSIFQRAFPEHIDQYHAFRYSESGKIPASPMSLPSMIICFSNLNVSMLSFLSLHDFHVTSHHLFGLLKISTMAALIIDPGQRGSCADIRSKNISDWIRAARETGAFRKLKVLVLLGMPMTSTSTIRDCTSSLPALTLLGTSKPRLGMLRTQMSDRQLLSTHGTLWTDKFDIDWNQPHPETVWEDPQLTKSAQIQMLYDMSTKATNQPTSTADAQPRVSLTYSALGNNIFVDEVYWLFRQRKSDCTPAQKRSLNALLAQQTKPAADKKRKIRASKKADIASFLDSFM